MQTVEMSMGPVMIEIERPMNEKLGLILSNYSSLHHANNFKLDEITPAGVFIASILPASIADRCGILTVGDQILAVDETVVENTSFTPDDVTALLDAISREYTQIHILPSHAMIRRRGEFFI